MTRRFALWLFCLFFILKIEAQKLTTERTSEGIFVKEGENPVLFFQQKTRSKDGLFPRADYVHPLYGLAGQVLTEDFPEDHYHHRGIFWTWHQVNLGDLRLGDAWSCENIAWDVVQLDPKPFGKHKLMLDVHTLWKSPLWLDTHGEKKAFMSEKTRITVYSRKKKYRRVDFEISLLALEKGLELGGSEDEKGYGGFSVRIKLPEDIQFSSEQGLVQPITNQIVSGSWMNMSGSMGKNGEHAGVVLFCHPDNPTYPEPWILRAKDSMQNAVFPGRHPVAISDTQPTILRYTLLIYQGELSERTIQKIKKSL